MFHNRATSQSQQNVCNILRLPSAPAAGIGFSPRVLLAGVFLFLALAMPAYGQTGQGSITGRITDPKGAVVAEAMIVVTNVETGVSQNTKSNSSGIYTVISLNPGNYIVSVTQKGFSKEIVDNIIVEAAATATVDAGLKVGQENVAITVNADAILLSKDTSDVLTTVDHDLVLSLPYPERSSLEAALLVPGVMGDPVYPGGIQSENPTLTTEATAPGAGIRISGGAPGTSTILVDGSDITQGSYPRTGVNLSGRIVQETTVITGGLSPKYGRTSGGVIIQTSKPGTDQYHGALTWRHTDPWFQAYPLGTNQPADRHENFYGIYFGGPIWIPKIYDGHHKSFFYVGIEPARLRNATGTRGTFFTPAELSGSMNDSLPLLNQTILKASGYAAAVAAPRIGGLYYQATPVNGFPNGPRLAASAYIPIPGNDLTQQVAANPFAKYVLSLMPTPSNPGPYVTFDNATGATMNDGTNAVYHRGVINVDNRYSFRIDHQFSDRDQIYVRYTGIPLNSKRYFAVAPDNPMTQTPTDSANAQNAAIGYTHVITNTMVNNLHFSFLRVNADRGVPDVDRTKDFGAAYGLTPATLGYGFPDLGSFSVTGDPAYSIQPGAATTYAQIDQNFVYGDDVTWTKGKHVISFGGDLRWIESNQYDTAGLTGGTYAFSQAYSSNGTTGGTPLASFALGLINGYKATPVSVPGYYRWRYYAGYFQDTWRVTANLTFNLGLRYDIETPRMEKFNNQPLALLNTQSTLNGVPTNASFCFPQACGGFGKTLWPTNYKGVQPRIGLSFAPYTKMTIRASYSMTKLPLTGYNNIPNPDLNTSSATVGGITGGLTNNSVVSYINNPVAPLSSAFTTLNGNRGPILYSTGLAPVYVAQTPATPYTQSWNMTLQYQPFASTLLQATYQGLNGTHLILPISGAQFGDLNSPAIGDVIAAVQNHAYLSQTSDNSYGITNTGTVLPATCATTKPDPCVAETNLQRLNPYQNFFNQSLAEIFARRGISHYNGLYLSLIERMGKNLTMLASYTWSKSLDNVAETTDANNTSQAGSAAPQYYSSLASDYSVAAFDQPSLLKVGYNYVLPIGDGQKLHLRSRLLNNIIGNLSTSGIYTGASGFPNFVNLGSAGYFNSFTPKGVNGCAATGANLYCVSAAVPGGLQLRPNLVPGVPLINKNWKQGLGTGVAGSNFVPYLNPAAFAVPGSPNSPALGNEPRTLANARSPREAYFDARVTKGFKIREKYTLNLMGTFNNAFNHPIYFGVGQSNRSLQTTATTSTVTGSTTFNSAATTFGKLSNNTSVMSRVIRVGAEFIF